MAAKIVRSVLLGAALALAGGVTTAVPQSQTQKANRETAQISDQDISEAYIYLLGRLMVTRQQQLDFQEGFKWNELVHRDGIHRSRTVRAARFSMAEIRREQTVCFRAGTAQSGRWRLAAVRQPLHQMYGPAVRRKDHRDGLVLR